MDYPVREEQINVMKRPQLNKIISDFDLPISATSRIKIKELRKLVIEELINFCSDDEVDIDEVIIVLGDHGSINNDQIYQSPSGTEIMVIMEEMLKPIDENLNGTIKDFGFSSSFDDDDYDNEDENHVENVTTALVIDESADRDFESVRVRDYNVESSQVFEKRTKKKYLRVVEPEIFFQFIKSKLNENQLTNMNERMEALAASVKGAQLLGQQGLYEELALKLSGIVKEQEAASLGCNKWIPYVAINFFIDRIAETQQNNENRRVRNNKEKEVIFDFFKRFPRAVPKEQAEKIKMVQDSKVFDQLYILYMSPVGVNLKTTKEKIRKKDPIVFGAFIHQPTRLYYICDWIDEWCDITLDKFIDTVQENPEMLPQEVKNVTREDINNIIEDVNKSYLRLKKTNINNYRKLMREEENQRQKRITKAKEVQSLSTETKKHFNFISWFKNILK